MPQSNNKGKRSYKILSLFRETLGNKYSQSRERRNLSILNHVRESQLLDHMKFPPTRGMFMRPWSKINSKKKIQHSSMVSDIKITPNTPQQLPLAKKPSQFVPKYFLVIWAINTHYSPLKIMTDTSKGAHNQKCPHASLNLFHHSHIPR